MEVKLVKSLEDLERVRKEAIERLRVREGKGEKRIVVGMGTCGIAAGAREVVGAIMDELALRKLSDVSVTQTGCVGLCEYEPLVDVYTPGLPKVTYAYVSPERARQIVARHIVNGQIIGEWTLPRK
jgi:(2Fe-2S) ferredoxin